MAFATPMPLRFRASLAALAMMAGTVTTAIAQEVNYSMTVRDGKFEPSTLNVKAGTKFKLTISNATAKAAEFESSELNREKIIPPNSSASVYIGPLEPGTYPFFDDFNQATRGQIIAK